MKLITSSRPLWARCLLLSIGLLLSFNSSGAGKIQPLYVVGLPGPAGGIVFYITGGGYAGAHGLEAAPVDHQDMVIPGWGCMQGASEYGGVAGATGSGVGTGKQNTLTILEFCSEPGIAAEITDNYVLNGFDDWFLPSIDELGLMYKNIGPGAPAPLTNAGGFNSYSEIFSQYYWSSTESDGSHALVIDFNIPSDGGGQQRSWPKDAPDIRVRAVRAF